MRYTQKSINDNGYDIHYEEKGMTHHRPYSRYDEYEQPVILKLGELEDKFEQGTLVELPYKIGDYIYCVYKGIEGWTIARHEIKSTKVTKNGLTITVYDLNSYGVKTGYSFELDEILGVTAFLEENQAKIKMLELKAEQQ